MMRNIRCRSNLRTEFLRNYTFIMGLVLFLYCFMVIMSEHNHDGLKRLGTSQVLQYIQKRNYPTVDIILLPPFVMGVGDAKSKNVTDTGVNYSVLSVMRFAPWVRRIHILDKNHVESKNQFEYWKTHQKSRIVHFHQDIVEYSLTSPFLSEYFLIMKPHFLLTNYLFNWQMFVGDNGEVNTPLSKGPEVDRPFSPVLRDCNLGVLPMTRTILNECCYVKLSPQNYYGYAYKKAIKNKNILYKNNLDHMVPPCSGSPITTMKYVPVFDEAKVRSYFEFEEPQKKRGGNNMPFEIVLVVSCRAIDDLLFALPKKYDNTIQIWINLTDLSKPMARLSFLHRMIVCKNVFIEILGSQFNWDCERIGAEVMRKIKMMGNDETFEVLDVFSYDAGDQNNSWYENKANIIANKLARVYAAPFSVLSERTEKDSSELHRLKML